jgi:lipoprotein NlpI
MVSIYNSRGLAYYGKSEFANAIEDFTKAIELNPRQSTVYFNRSVAYYEIGKDSLAAADRQR